MVRKRKGHRERKRKKSVRFFTGGLQTDFKENEENNRRGEIKNDTNKGVYR